jgi:eukaryotic-like serine/threonine-protein kinase
MTDDSLLGQLADEFTRGAREGKSPDIEDYAKNYPELADRIRQLFPTLMLLEGMAAIGDSIETEAKQSPLSAGVVFGSYRIEREIGRGGMGIVYEAVHVLLEKKVALKVLPVRTLVGAEHLERFFREARTAACLHHTNIVPVFDVGQVSGTPYFAMQYIEGSSLDHILRLMQSTTNGSCPSEAPGESSEQKTGSLKKKKRAARVTTDQAGRVLAGLPARPEDYFRWVANIGIQAAEGLAYAHERRIIHRDIKPSNLLLDKQGVLWIADFGLARKIEDSAMTQNGVMMGTPRYMSPEQAESARRPVDQRSDIYSLGATLYELLTCRPVFEGKTPQEVLMQIVTREPVALKQLNSEIPSDLATIAMKAMAKRPEDRYQSVLELSNDLQHWQRMEPIKARPIGPVGRFIQWCRRNPRLAAVTTIAAVIILALSGIYYARLIVENVKTHEALIKERQARSQAIAALNQAESARRESQNSELRAQAAKRQADDARKTAEMERDSARTAKGLESAALKREKQQSYTANLLAANLQLRSGFPRIAQQYLNRCDPSLRGWEWNYLFLKADSSITTLYFPEFTSIQARYSPETFKSNPASFSFSPDGEHICWKNEIGIYSWSRRTGSLSYTIGGMGSLRDVSSLRAVSSGGSMILSNNPWRVIETATGRVISKLDFSDDKNYSAAISNEKTYPAVFSPDGANIAVAVPIQTEMGMKKVIYLIDTISGKRIHSIPESVQWYSSAAFSLAFSLDGTRLVSGSFDGNVLLWDVKSGKRILTLNRNQSTSFPSTFSPISAFAFGCNDRRLAVGYLDGSIEVWNPSSGDFQFSIKGPETMHALAFNSDCSQFASAGNDIRIWDGAWNAKSGREIAVLSSGISLIPTDSIAESANFLYNSVAFSPEGDRLFAGTNNHVKVWDTKSYQEIETLQGDISLVDLALSPDGSTIATASYEGVTIWDIKSGRKISQTSNFRRLRSGTPSLDFSPDGTLIATMAEDKTAKIWDIRSGQEQMSFVGHEDFITSISFNRHGDRLATGSIDGTVRIWDVQSGKQISILRLEGRDFVWVHVDFSPDGRHIATAFTGTYNPDADPVQIWDVNSGTKLLSLKIPRSSIGTELTSFFNQKSSHHQSMGAVRFSPDGKRIAASFLDLHTIEIWDSSSGDHLATLRGYLPGNFAFSPDGRRIVSTTSRTIAGVNDFFAIWDTFSSDLLLKVSGADSRITSIKAVFSPDGNRIVSIASDEKIRIWNSRSVYANMPDFNYSQINNPKDTKDLSQTKKSFSWNWPGVFPLKSDR